MIMRPVLCLASALLLAGCYPVKQYQSNMVGQFPSIEGQQNSPAMQRQRPAAIENLPAAEWLPASPSASAISLQTSEWFRGFK